MNYTVSTLFMAFAKGQESTEFEVKRYIGVAPVQILKVNPTKVEIGEVFGNEPEEAPKYTGTTTIDDKEVKQARIDFIVRTVAEKANNISLNTRVTFFISDAPQFNRDKSKVQVVNKYGEFAYLPIEDVKNKTFPDNMNWYCMDGVRPAYRGEEHLTGFLKDFLCVPNRTYTDKKDGARKEIKDLSEAEAQLGHISDYFNGDISEIRDILSSRPDNLIKLCFGVKTTDDNKMYQDVFIRHTVRNRSTNYSKLDSEIQAAKNAGSYPNTEFSVEPLHEYSVQATTFSEAPSGEAPKGWFE